MVALENVKISTPKKEEEKKHEAKGRNLGSKSLAHEFPRMHMNGKKLWQWALFTSSNNECTGTNTENPYIELY